MRIYLFIFFSLHQNSLVRNRFNPQFCRKHIWFSPTCPFRVYFLSISVTTPFCCLEQNSPEYFHWQQQQIFLFKKIILRYFSSPLALSLSRTTHTISGRSCLADKQMSNYLSISSRAAKVHRSWINQENKKKNNAIDADTSAWRRQWSLISHSLTPNRTMNVWRLIRRILTFGIQLDVRIRMNVERNEYRHVVRLMDEYGYGCVYVCANALETSKWINQCHVMRCGNGINCRLITIIDATFAQPNLMKTKRNGKLKAFFKYYNTTPSTPKTWFLSREMIMP